MFTTPQPSVRLVELPAFDCWQLLESADIARLAWSGADGVVIVPVNYVVADGSLWFRTGPTSQIARECEGQPITAEVDQLDSIDHSGWSVLIRGVAETLAADDAPEHLAEFRVWPPGPRPLFVRLDPIELTGRKLLPPTLEA